MTAPELAWELICNCENGLRYFNELPAQILDVKRWFDEECRINDFITICGESGYDVLPIEQTIFAAMPLPGKLVLIKKGYNKSQQLKKYYDF